METVAQPQPTKPKQASAPTVKPGGTVDLDGTTLQVDKHLGEGVYGDVFLVTDTAAGAKRALKVLRPRRSDTRSLRSERNAYRTLEQKCQEAIGPAGTHQLPCMLAQESFKDGSALLLTDLAPGTKGTTAFKTGRRDLKEMDFFDFLVMAVQPVAAMHEAKVTHGDLKPENMVMSFDPATGACNSLMLVDFGLSCDLGGLDTRERDTCHNFFPKVPSYMDPAYTKGVSNLFQADMFSVGAMISYFVRKQWEAKVISQAAFNYISSIAANLMQKRVLSRLTAKQTIAALRRASHRPGETIQVGGLEVTVDKRGYISRKFIRCVLAVTTSRGEAAVLKLLLRKGSYKRCAERELRILSSLVPEGAEASPGLPVLYAQQLNRDLKETLLVVSAPGGAAGLDLSEMLMRDGIPVSNGSADRTRREQIMLAMAEALERIHKSPARVAIGDTSVSNFRVTDEIQGPIGPKKMGLVPVDFGKACSVGMQRDRPDLCAQQGFNIFASDVKALAGTWEEVFKQGVANVSMLKRMQRSPISKRATMADVIRELRTALGR